MFYSKTKYGPLVFFHRHSNFFNVEHLSVSLQVIFISINIELQYGMGRPYALNTDRSVIPI